MKYRNRNLREAVTETLEEFITLLTVRRDMARDCLGRKHPYAVNYANRLRRAVRVLKRWEKSRHRTREGGIA